MTKFNVGDKVRYLGGDWFDNGEILTVLENDGGEWMAIQATNDIDTYWMGASEIELVSSKSTKKQRLSALEQQVAELQAEVATLKLGGTITHSVTVTPKETTPNEQRKAIIAEAKAFVEELMEYVAQSGYSKYHKYGEIKFDVYAFVSKTYFKVKADKREVTVVIKPNHGRFVTSKAIAKCAPDDVFNADIGKAIALGRALGLDVERFEQVVKPTEVVVGMVVQFYSYSGKAFDPAKITKVDENDGSILAEGLGRSFYDPAKTNDQITDDTDAQY